MTRHLKKAGLCAALFAAIGLAAAPAEARRHYYRGHGNGDAIVAGIAGLAIGAAIASSSRNRGYYDDRGYYSDRRYYRGSRSYYRDRYHAPRRSYYRDSRYGNYRDRWSYRERCRTERHYDRYYGRVVRTRVCY